MSRTKFPRGNYRSKWDLEHESDDEYSRSKGKQEVKELVEELEEDADLKPFWEEVVPEEKNG